MNDLRQDNCVGLAARLGFVSLVMASQAICGVPAFAGWFLSVPWPPPSWALPVGVLLFIPAGLGGVILGRRIVPGGKRLSGIPVASGTVAGFVAGWWVFEFGSRGQPLVGWTPVMGLGESAAGWVFLAAVPYLIGVAASFLRWSPNVVSLAQRIHRE
jgi:hypothetical protein